MKPTLYFTLVRNWYVGGFKVMRVTTEKTKQLYGSFIDEDMATHCSPRQAVGKFETAEAAQARIDDVQRVRKKYAPAIKAASDALTKLHHAEQQEIDAAAKGLLVIGGGP
jgi:hypothetical protein